METTKSIFQLHDSELRNQINDLLPKKVLIVEDNKTVANDFTFYLDKVYESRGQEGGPWVDQTYCIEDALEKLVHHAEDYSLVLIDIALPETREDVQECERMEEERNRLAKDFGKTDDVAKRRRLSKEINTIDDKIAGLCRIDGGIKLIELWHEKHGPLSDDDLPKVIFFTAQLNDVDRFQKKYEGCISDCGIKNPGWMLKEVGETSFLRKLLQTLQ